MLTNYLKFACAVAATVVLASCAVVDKPIPLPVGRWEMTGSNFLEIGRMPGLPRATLHIGDGRVSAFGGCNTANAEVSAVDGRMQVGALATTRRACPEPAGIFEARLFKLLREQPYFRIEDGMLILAAGELSARFRRMTDKPPAAKPSS